MRGKPNVAKLDVVRHKAKTVSPTLSDLEKGKEMVEQGELSKAELEDLEKAHAERKQLERSTFDR